jgi:hypothetical protein
MVMRAVSMWVMVARSALAQIPMMGVDLGIALIAMLVIVVANALVVLAVRDRF